MIAYSYVHMITNESLPINFLPVNKARHELFNHQAIPTKPKLKDWVLYPSNHLLKVGLKNGLVTEFNLLPIDCVQPNILLKRFLDCYLTVINTRQYPGTAFN